MDGNFAHRTNTPKENAVHRIIPRDPLGDIGGRGDLGKKEKGGKVQNERRGRKTRRFPNLGYFRIANEEQHPHAQTLRAPGGEAGYLQNWERSNSIR